MDIGPVIFADVDTQIAWFHVKVLSLWSEYDNSSEKGHTRQAKVMYIGPTCRNTCSLRAF